jgi:hypothetical protein
MKAKDYFNRYLNDYQDKTKEWKIIKIFRDIFCEAEEIAKKRGAVTDTAYQSIFKELNAKANAFCRMVNEKDDMGLKQDAFMIFVESENPKFYKAVYPNGM